MYDWESGPEVTEYDNWLEALEEEYGDYLTKTCKCEVTNECECMSFEQFKDKTQKDLESYWDWREPEDELHHA